MKDVLLFTEALDPCLALPPLQKLLHIFQARADRMELLPTCILPSVAFYSCSYTTKAYDTKLQPTAHKKLTRNTNITIHLQHAVRRHPLPQVRRHNQLGPPHRTTRFPRPFTRNQNKQQRHHLTSKPTGHILHNRHPRHPLPPPPPLRHLCPPNLHFPPRFDRATPARPLRPRSDLLHLRLPARTRARRSSSVFAVDESCGGGRCRG